MNLTSSVQNPFSLIQVNKLFHRPERNYKFIDGIRAIAILWVIVFHVWLFHIQAYPEQCQKITNYPFLVWITKGDLGVDLFFVISGFLIGNLLFKEYIKRGTIRIKRFYLRRFLRLMPVYVACMIGGALLSKDTPLENYHMAWANLLYINNYIAHSYMSWTWSLAIEEQFYLFIPFVILFFFSRIGNKLWFFVPLAILSPVLKYYFSTTVLDFTWPMKSVFYDDEWHNWFWHYYVLTHFRYGGLLAGIAVAYLHNYQQERVRGFFEKHTRLVKWLVSMSLLLIIFIASLSLGQWSNVESSIFYHLPKRVASFYEAIHRELFYYAVAFIVAACLYSEVSIVNAVRKFLSKKFFFPIAQVSYSAYLFHEMFMYLYFLQTESWFEGTNVPVWGILLINGFISIVVVLFVASLMYLFVELPFQQLKEKWT